MSQPLITFRDLRSPEGNVQFRSRIEYVKHASKHIDVSRNTVIHLICCGAITVAKSFEELCTCNTLYNSDTLELKGV